MNYLERKAARRIQYKNNIGKKTGDLTEIMQVRLFYKTEAPEAQDALEIEQKEVAAKNFLNECNKYYYNDN